MVGNKWYVPPALTPPGAVQDGRTEIGILAPNYGLEHLSYLMHLPEFRHVRVKRLPLHRLERKGTFWDKTAIPLRAPVPLLHTFNHLPMTGPPFVVSFELELPFYLGPHRDWQHRIGHSILASPRCRAILALSDTAADLARQKFTAAGRPEIVDKIGTFRGAVMPSQVAERPELGSCGALRLLFVGADGLRKGIVPVLEAVAHLRDKGAEIELTVVSSMLETSYAVADPAPGAAALSQRMQDSPWITHHRSLPYAEVRAAMAAHDLFIFPTLDETLGWVVIEAAMEGIATIASNIFALPELIEDGVSGRLIALPLNNRNRWSGLFASDRRAAQTDAYDRLRTGLVTALEEVLQNPGLARKWGRNAQAKLAAAYDPAVAAPQLSQIYHAAL